MQACNPGLTRRSRPTASRRAATAPAAANAVEAVLALLAASEAARQKAERERAAADAARRRAVEANQAKAQFLATMSHELRTPLNAVGGYVQLLDMELYGPVTEGQRGALARMQAAQQHLVGLINDVLKFAKLEAGKLEYDVHAVDLRAVVAAATPLVDPQIVTKGIQLDVRLPDRPCAVWADPDKLGQVLVNLLSNAVKFTNARGRIRVDVTTRAGDSAGGRAADGASRVFLRVTDTGRGIPRDRQDAVFEPFVQVRAPGGVSHEGTGLGLAISRDLTRGMGGDLRVRSREGEGSAFTVTLRRAPAAATA
ncbi:hypothetical protein tb265_46870 [Gemmatimonadetes bacterium T265]|nr:hypothetical protein tb265_46870 [Gemmatimonadetes bacterium T265]